mmetsp:Transcript_15898/g.31167  ORF Transcript_15898/g.31167 Transcript_15898/m.31167 type:complete len:1174 (+) Transcript_15898:40-3561(+)|eukprot:CAMPEP_0175137632 /NCGR_PEP_ID=MMETSP0087-20121206/9917_1 /TAXON_ID=136419 /ORGANISM="Unknown Unknown, Strain D1" /LENGTH=1173 /DNA_ID=CAMNT_0016420477 /DNA_START=40 /DNA_END=3561 /DNA_ORIENTATION=-
MWVKEVIVDGFKSYANRTVISGWDSQFNAITGLNGTGKSNILDSICFVLGISVLSQVRVSNLQELVYKQGQSRVTKASVTIVFDNRDTKNSPVGYEQYEEITITRQVVIGGKNKYLINGVTAQLGRVQNLFHSVQLNVNNPHFLIMQGRITKVINMKPPEILGMIEEAAGTRMYENKKNAAIKTIAKKQTKVDEINKILVEELTPTLESLRKERSSFMKYSANNTEIERLSRFTTAASFMAAEQIAERSNGDVTGMENHKEELMQKCIGLEEEIQEKDLEAKALLKEKDTELSTQFKEQEKIVQEFSKELVKHTAAWQHQKDSLAADLKDQTKLGDSVKSLTKTLASKDKELAKLEEAFTKMQDAHTDLLTHLESLQGQLLGIDMSNNQKEQGTVTQQLMEAQRQVAELEAIAKQSSIKAEHMKKAVAEKKTASKSAEKAYNTMAKSLDEKVRSLAKVEAKLETINFDPKARVQVEEEISEISNEVSEMSEKVEQLRARLSHQVNLDFRAKGFNKESVKGKVIKLIKVKDSQNAMALEVTAGSKLFNVVVDNEQTGKALLQNGQLKKRVTIIPLNKIARRSLDPAKVARAKSLVGEENVQSALTLVGYSNEIQAAMEYVFGGTFVCKDSETAEKVTFDAAIKTRSVTLQGDVFDPKGTLTGGSAPRGGSVLLQLQQLTSLEEQLAEGEKRLAQLKKQSKTLAAAEENSEELISSKELLSHEVELLKKRVEATPYAQLQAEVEQMTASMKEADAAAKQAATDKNEQVKKVKELEQSVKDFEKGRKDKVKQIESEMAGGKKRVAESLKKVKAAETARDQCALERDDIVKEIESVEEQVASGQGKANELTEVVEEKGKLVAASKKAYDAANAKLTAEKERLAAHEKEISGLEKMKNKLKKRIADNQIEIKKITHKIARMSADKSDAVKRVEAMLKKYSWIKSEKKFFGKPHTDYDFDKVSVKQAETRLHALKNEQEELSKTINKKVMGMFEKAEQEYQDLMKKKEIIEKDKQKIEEVILELDRKKNEVLETTWKKVTKDFGNIFSTLLPGTKAKLEPPEGCSVLDGLEVKVAFGSVWKESLTELSGGQRSLLALSLILALLLFKPAPMYILDEIDAALDLSHTQNIGTMLKTHFPQSQFIVVSLKEGMFNNANVIFRTKFVDGVSAVTRTSNKQRA